jgi:hypothetical protein
VRRTTQAGTDPVAAVDSRTVEVRLTLSDEATALLRRRSNMQVQVAIQPMASRHGWRRDERAVAAAPPASLGARAERRGRAAPRVAPPEPGLLDALRLPLRLAARQLRADRAKLATAIAA